MGDLPNLDYTINDPAAVECPYCHEKMEFDDQMVGEMSDSPGGAGMNCDHCNRRLTIKINIDVTVLAWKPEALR
jgi:DNA-directed RNA polymerase subunit RPC12/RpoP